MYRIHFIFGFGAAFLDSIVIKDVALPFAISSLRWSSSLLGLVCVRNVYVGHFYCVLSFHFTAIWKQNTNAQVEFSTDGRRKKRPNNHCIHSVVVGVPFFVLYCYYSNWTYFSVMALFKPIRCRQKSTPQISHINSSVQGESISAECKCAHLSSIPNSVNRKIFGTYVAIVCVLWRA